MAEDKLMELINKNVSEILQANSEIITKRQINLIQNLNPSSINDICDLHMAMAQYTREMADLICIIVSKILFDAGVLDVHSEDK